MHCHDVVLGHKGGVWWTCWLTPFKLHSCPDIHFPKCRSKWLSFEKCHLLEQTSLSELRASALERCFRGHTNHAIETLLVKYNACSASNHWRLFACRCSRLLVLICKRRKL